MSEKERCACGKEAELIYMGEPVCRDCREGRDSVFDDDDEVSETRTRGERTDRFRYREVD